MTAATGVGSMPGGDPVAAETDNAREYAEAVRVVLGELPDLPHVPELPGRGPGATLTGRGLAVVDGLGFDLQPAGWRLTDASGVDHRRARSLLAQDLDAVEEQAQAWSGRFKTQVAGPWTLAATVERPRGDKVLADHGARRDLADALAEGIGAHVHDVRRRLPRTAELVVQVDEPSLPAVLDGRVPTASGFGRHRTVHPPEASDLLGRVLGAVAAAGGTPVVHCCAAGFPVRLVRDAGAAGVSVDLGVLDAAGHDALAEAVEAGETVLLGVVPSTEPVTDPAGRGAGSRTAGGGTDPDEQAATEGVLRWLEMLGLDPAEHARQLVLTPTCGLAGATPAWSRRALALAVRAARHLS